MGDGNKSFDRASQIFDIVLKPALGEINQIVSGARLVFVDEALVDNDEVVLGLRQLLGREASSVLGRFQEPDNFESLPSPIDEQVRGRVYVVLYQNHGAARKNYGDWRFTVATADSASMSQFYDNEVFAFDVRQVGD